MTLEIELGDRLLLQRAPHPAAIRFPIKATWADEPGLPVDVTLEIDARPGRDVLGVRDLRLTARPGEDDIKPATLSHVPLFRLLDASVEAASTKLATRTDGSLEVNLQGIAWMMGGAAWPADPASAQAVRSSTGRRTGPGPERVSDDQLQRAAKVYREAVRAKTSPRKAIADELGVNLATASKYTVEARERGFLGKALNRKAGEAEPIDAPLGTTTTDESALG